MAILPRHRPGVLGPPLLDRLLCAIDGSRGSGEAVREALAFAPCATRLRFIAVTDIRGDGGRRVVSLAAHRARHALEQAQAQAGARGLTADTEIVDAPDVAATLIARAGDGTLLVVGSHGDGGAAGAPTGSIAAALAAQAAGALLVARAGARVDAAGPRILVAVDDSAGATALARVAGALAAGCHGYVHLVHVPGRGYGSPMRHRLAELATALIEQTGAEPVVEVARAANVAAQVCQLARDSESSLVVVGRHDRAGGGRTTAAVGERIVHDAPCSVLVVPATARA
jgi:nucleotide-binding universal stress UspA family protein